jgi:hypothetical protein
VFVEKAKALERDLDSVVPGTSSSLGIDAYPVDPPIDTETCRFLANAANADHGIISVISNAPHAIVDTKTAMLVRIPYVGSLVD